MRESELPRGVEVSAQWEIYCAAVVGCELLLLGGLGVVSGDLAA